MTAFLEVFYFLEIGAPTTRSYHVYILKLGLASENQEEIDLYNHYQKNIYSAQNQQQQQKKNS